MNIAFDVDGCLIKDGEPIKENLELLKVLSKSHKIYLWSGNGWLYAFKWADKLDLNMLSGVLDKYNTFKPDIAFDDKEIDLGKLNIKI
jgi:hydroxymethylpyrimidine pyrophosphatase-like HAD family hydrolase